MKRKLFNYPFGLIMSALMLIFSATSCTKKTNEVVKPAVPEEFATAPGGNKPGTTTEVSLSMTINDATGNKITSDNLGPYVNGVGNVKVVFDKSGNFMFGAASSSPRVPPMTRFLNFSFDSPLPTYNARSAETSNFISTITTVTSPNPTALQNLNIGDTKCIGFSAGLINISGGVVNFHRNTNTEDTPTTPTAYVYVTRNSPTEWTMTPVPPPVGCSNISNVAALRINTTLYGYYNMPFSFTLTQIP